jgi:hypothetical protein
MQPEFMPLLDTPNTNTPEWQLAQDLAIVLGDIQHIDRYLLYVRDYTPAFLHSTLSEVSRYPLHKIKKSKAALFHFLVRKYGEQNKRHHWD